MARKSISAIVFATVTLLIAGGCGGGGVLTNLFAGDYTGTAPLQTNATGDVTFTVDPDGAAQGHLVVAVTPMHASPQAFQDPGFSAGTYTLLGSANGGALNLEGNANGMPFTVTATIVGSGTVPMVISKGGTNYQGTVHKDTSSGGDTQADVSITVTEAGNMDATHFPTGAVQAFPDVDESDVIVQFFDASNRAVGVTVPNSLAVGGTYTLDSLHRFVSYREPGSDPDFGDTWSATSGTFTLNARNGSHISVTLNNVVCPANTMFGNATGTVKLNGTLQN